MAQFLAIECTYLRFDQDDGVNHGKLLKEAFLYFDRHMRLFLEFGEVTILKFMIFRKDDSFCEVEVALCDKLILEFTLSSYPQ